MIIYSLLSAQNVWINSSECFGLREVQKSTCTSSMHEFELLIHRWGLVGILICHWSNYKWKHNSFYKMFMATFIFSHYSARSCFIQAGNHPSRWSCVSTWKLFTKSLIMRPLISFAAAVWLIFICCSVSLKLKRQMTACGPGHLLEASCLSKLASSDQW